MLLRITGGRAPVWHATSASTPQASQRSLPRLRPSARRVDLGFGEKQVRGPDAWRDPLPCARGSRSGAAFVAKVYLRAEAIVGSRALT